MARREVTHFFDDLDNTQLTEDSVHILHFSVNGVDYVLDLSEDNADGFRRLLEPYIAAARTVKSTRAARRERVSTRNDSRAIRQWAQEQGMQIADRGKIPHQVIEAYDRAHA